jgi:hypothetical protein
VPERRLPPVAIVIAFIDCVNRGDVPGLGELMAEDHSLSVFDEPPLTGRSRNIDAWQGYLTSYPNYVIHPRRVAASADRVAVLGHTTGSHLGLPDHEEETRTLIWVADVQRDLVRSWRLMNDTDEHRHLLGLDLV